MCENDFLRALDLTKRGQTHDCRVNDAAGANFELIRMGYEGAIAESKPTLVAAELAIASQFLSQQFPRAQIAPASSDWYSFESVCAYGIQCFVNPLVITRC